MGSIKTIDVGTKEPKSTLDLISLKSLSRKLKKNAAFYDIAIDVISQAANAIIEESNLGNVNFSLKNSSEFYEIILSDDYQMPSAILTGESNKYQYVIVVLIEYDTEEADVDKNVNNNIVLVHDDNEYCDIPSGATSIVLRLNKKGMRICSQYEPLTKKWEKVDLMATIGYTENQLSTLISKDRNDLSMVVLTLYKDTYDESLSDEELKQLMDDNKEILNLNSFFEDNSVLTFASDSNKKKSLCITPNDGVNCNMITYEKGYYCVDVCLFGKYIQTVYKTTDKERIIDFANFLFYRLYPNDVIIDAFVSRDTFITFNRKGELHTHIPSNRSQLKLTPDESEIVNIVYSILEAKLCN